MRRAALVFLMLATSPCASSGADQGEPAFRPTPLPHEDQPHSVPYVLKPSDSAACAAEISERDGIVRLSLLDSARAGRQTTFTLDGLTYASHFDALGRLDAQAPMFHATADLAWIGQGGRECSQSGLSFSGIQSAFFIALVWSDTQINLALHVVEPPTGRLGGDHNYVFPGRPNAEGSVAYGHLLTFGEPVAGTSQVELYSLPAGRNPHDGIVYAFVEFVSRGNPASAPFCGEDPRAVAPFTLVHRDGTAMSRIKSRFGAVPCGTPWTGDLEISGYYQGPWKWKM